MKPPRRIYIGMEDYIVRVTKNMPNDFYGETKNDLSEIDLHPEQSPGKLRLTTVHESLHAIIHVFGIGRVMGLNHESEEQFVVSLSPWILAWLRDNPKLVEFLMENRDREY